MKRPLAYITAAWLGGDSENAEQAARYCRAVYEAGFSPICPPLYLPLFLNDPRYDTSSFFLECACALIGILLLISYNEKKGKAYCQWFHYIAYPAHLLLLYILNTCIIKI